MTTDQEQEHCKRVASAMLQEYTGTPPAPSLLRSLVAMTIRRERAAARAERWRPIATAPRDMHVLVHHPLWPVQPVRIAIWDNGVWRDDGDNELLATHWMPLPPAPEVP